MTMATACVVALVLGILSGSAAAQIAYVVTTNLFPHQGIVLESRSSYVEALFLP